MSIALDKIYIKKAQAGRLPLTTWANMTPARVCLSHVRRIQPTIPLSLVADGIRELQVGQYKPIRSKNRNGARLSSEIVKLTLFAF